LNDHVTRPLPDPGHWVDRLLLQGPGPGICLRFGAPLDRTGLRIEVQRRQRQLHDAGLRPGGTAALRLPPSPALVTVLLAAWRTGAQVSLLDHRLTDTETARALEHLAPQVLVHSGAAPAGPALRGYTDPEPLFTARPGGRPAQGPQCLVQLSSGSTGPAKAIARTAGDLEAELDRFSRLPQFPGPGSRVVLLSSMVHVLGLVGGLLHALHSRAELVLPDRLTASSILDAVRAGPRPTTVIGVPFHAELLAAVADPPPTPMLERMIVAGEPVRPAVPAAFTARYGVPLGTMYGMTETGVIATDLDGALRPAHRPVHGMRLRVVDGELWIGASRSPYLGAGDPQRWSDGWLRTRDAAELDPDGGRLTVLGRRDSQVSIGGLKVDLTEVELALRAVSGVREAVVVFDRGAIEGYVALDEGTDAQRVRAELGIGFAAYKLPRRLRVLPVLPRTDTGKLLRAAPVLRAAADRHSPTR